MSILIWVQLVLQILGGIEPLIRKKLGPGHSVVLEIQKAIAALQAVRGSEVTRAQLESMRYQPKW